MRGWGDMSGARALKHRRLQGCALLLAFVACVPLSNWLILNVGVVCTKDGPCLVPVFPGVWAPSGVMAAGVAFVLRDLVQERIGPLWAASAIFVGGAISFFLSQPSLAMASIGSFVVAETVDLMIFSLLRRRGFVTAVIFSSIGGLVIDSLIFVYLAFGSIDHVEGQIIGKAWALLMIMPVLVAWRRQTSGTASALADA